MEELSNRFPHLASNILNEINDQSLFNFKESSREMKSFIVSEKFFWKRIIWNYKGNLAEFKESWKKTIDRSSVDFVMELSQATYRFFTKRSSRFEKQWHPLFIAGDHECLQLFKCIFEKVDDKNPKGYLGLSVLHLAAQEGCLNICKFILENVDDKIFLDDKGGTPLHRAAIKGYVEVCKLLLNHLADKNLGNNEGKTPLHYAAANGNLEVCKVVIDVVADKNPRSICHFGFTPLHVAAQRGHLEVCKLLIEKASEKNPRDNFGNTPVSSAIKNNHFEIARFITKYLDPNDEQKMLVAWACGNDI